ncbi:MAG: hypothetical protein ABJH05_05895 [Fulvivirga sp.]
MKGFLKHLNLSVIKSNLLKMDEEEFMQVVKHIEETAYDLREGKLHRKYVNLYGWCRAVFPERFEKQKPSLF